MKNKRLYLLMSVVLACKLLLSSCKNEQYNVVLILVDDLGWTDLGVMGSPLYQTPNVDQLAEKGTLFTNAYASCTVCSPTRASIMTGKYPATINCTDWIQGHKMPKAKLLVPDWTMYMDTSEYNLAKVFNDNGYLTAHIGKWHLGDEEIYWPENQGFDVNIGGWAKGSPTRNKKEGKNGYFAPFGNPRLEDKQDDDYLTERLAGEACDFIASNHPDSTGQPFFLNFWLYNVHLPLQAKSDKIEKYKSLIDSTSQHLNPVYAAMVEHMDDAVGEIVNCLKKNGLDKNTIIVFTSDNGGFAYKRKKIITSNFPLREGKGHVYEGGVRVPMIIHNPALEKQTKVSHQPVLSNDIYPTLVQMADLKMPNKHKLQLQGRSLDKVVEDDIQTDRETLFWHYPHYHPLGATPYSAVRKGDWKLIRFFEDDRYELYNLKDDISEKNDLALTHVQKLDELKSDLFEWYNTVDAQMPQANPNYDPDNWKKH